MGDVLGVARVPEGAFEGDHGHLEAGHVAGERRTLGRERLLVRDERELERQQALGGPAHVGIEAVERAAQAGDRRRRPRLVGRRHHQRRQQQLLRLAHLVDGGLDEGALGQDHQQIRGSCSSIGISRTRRVP
jgi:hypothetical protein